jgi:TldD protein
MLNRREIKEIIPILRKDVRRALSMRISGYPGVYFCSFLLRDVDWFNTWSAAGSTFRTRVDKTRNVLCDLRVGSYRYDQTTNGGLSEDDADLESTKHVNVPVDSRFFGGLRLVLWRLTEAKFREALKDYSAKEAARVASADSVRGLPNFTRIKRVRIEKRCVPQKIDSRRWEEFVRRASDYADSLPQVSTSWVEFESNQESKVFISSEGSSVVQHTRVFSLTCTMRRIMGDGTTIEQDVVLNAGDLRELPSLARFKRMIAAKHRKLLDLSRAKEIHAFSGPVLLYPRPAALLFHETLGHRLEGSRLLSSEEGQTLKGLEGKRITNSALEIRDNPTLKRFKGEVCIGSYDVDDEGTPALNTLLVDRGVLKGFLNTRAVTHRKGFVPNGHARSKRHRRPVSRMGVFTVSGHETTTLQELRKRLLEEVKKQGKPFGMIVYETSGGETDTTNYDFQAFRGEISYATLLYPNGRERLVRGVNIVGTPLQSLDNVIGIGDHRELDNSFCGAESGLLPVSMIAPAVLLSNLELQAKSEESAPPSILKKPRG